MWIAMEHLHSPVCDVIRRNQTDSGVAFLPAVSLRFAMDPRELRSQFEIGRLRFELSGNPAPDLSPGRADAVLLYRKSAASSLCAPAGPRAGPPRPGFDETA